MGLVNSLLVTGGGGFIGTQLSLSLQHDDRFYRVAILSRDWHKHEALKAKLDKPDKFRWFIGDIGDKDRLRRAFQGIDYIIHAAAHKDVVSSQYSPRETALNNNVIGTQNVIDAAIDACVKRVLFISSDKAVDATNAYGKSKALGEDLVIAANSYSPRGTKFSVSRYGNIWNSSGSVGPIFKEQAKTGTLTLTDDRMTRFWFRAEAAVQFVLLCLDQMRGGEIFIPKLSSSKVMDVARVISPTATIQVTGIRPGEKLHELMVSETESHRTKELPWCYRIEPTIRFWDAATSYPGGSPVPWGWVYSSASAPRLTQEQLQDMVK